MLAGGPPNVHLWSQSPLGPDIEFDIRANVQSNAPHHTMFCSLREAARLTQWEVGEVVMSKVKQASKGMRMCKQAWVDMGDMHA